MPDFKSNFPFVEIYIRFQLKYQVLTPFWSCLLLRVSLSAVGFYSTLPSYEHPCLRKTQSHPKFSSYIFPPFFPMFPAANPSAKRTPGSIGCGLHRRELEDELAPTRCSILPRGLVGGTSPSLHHSFFFWKFDYIALVGKTYSENQLAKEHMLMGQILIGKNRKPSQNFFLAISFIASLLCNSIQICFIT